MMNVFLYFKLASGDLASFKTSFGTNNYTCPIKSHKLRSHSLSKASGTLQLDHYFFPMAFESLWFHSQYQMKTKNIRGCSISSKCAGQVGQEIYSKPNNCVWKAYWRLILGITPMEGREGNRIEQKRSYELILQCSLELNQGILVSMSPQRGYPVIGSRLDGPKEELLWVEIVPRERGKIQLVCHQQHGESVTQSQRVI